MKKNKLQFRLTMCFTIFLIFCGFTSINTPLAAPQLEVLMIATVIAGEATYIDASAPNSNFDNGLLFIAHDGFNPSQVTLLEFDLTGITFAIDKARLNMAVINSPGSPCFITSDAVNEINLYGTDDGWVEGTVTWNTQPTRGNLLDDLDQNPLDPNAHAHWSDVAGGGTFAIFLETERSSDGIASLWIEIPSGLSQVVLEDEDGTGGTSGCNGADLLPILQLADVDEPTAIALMDINASSKPSSFIIPGFFLFVTLILLGIFWIRRITKA